MTENEARALFCNIYNSEESDAEKLAAIKAIIGMETHRGISKQELINALDWLMDKSGAAMEKLMPKATNIWGDGYDDEGNMIYDMYECPNCGKNYEIDYEKYDHCPACGQAIDWRGYDSEN